MVLEHRGAKFGVSPPIAEDNARNVLELTVPQEWPSAFFVFLFLFFF